MARKNTKTAHVMSLLTKPRDDEEQVETALDKVEGDVSPSAIETAAQNNSDNEKIAQDIRKALEESLLMEAQPKEPVVRPFIPPVVKSQPEAQPAYQQEVPSNVIHGGQDTPRNIQSFAPADFESFDEKPAVTTAPQPAYTYSTPQPKYSASQKIVTPASAPYVPSKGVFKKDGKDMTHPDEEFVCRNIAEEVVVTLIPEMIRKFGICPCAQCKNDILAISLNMIPPKYVCTKKGMLFSRVATYELQNSTDVLSAITKACMKVKEKPSHN